MRANDHLRGMRTVHRFLKPSVPSFVFIRKRECRDSRAHRVCDCMSVCASLCPNESENMCGLVLAAQMIHTERARISAAGRDFLKLCGGCSCFELPHSAETALDVQSHRRGSVLGLFPIRICLDSHSPRSN